MDKELKQKLIELYDFCEKNNIPVFIATWRDNIKKNNGYDYSLFLPKDFDATLDEFDIQNKFPLFLRAIKGDWRKKYDDLD